ncbi:MAG: hypothetical protein ACP5KV_07635 [Candidatus Methanomethylicaceae archaeon]
MRRKRVTTEEEPTERHWCIHRDMFCDPESCAWFKYVCDGYGPRIIKRRAVA